MLCILLYICHPFILTPSFRLVSKVYQVKKGSVFFSGVAQFLAGIGLVYLAEIGILYLTAYRIYMENEKYLETLLWKLIKLKLMIMVCI